MDALGQPMVEMVWLFFGSVSVSRVNFLGIRKVVAQNGFNMAAGFSLGDFLVFYLEYNFIVINSQVKHHTDKLWQPLKNLPCLELCPSHLCVFYAILKLWSFP